MGTYTCCHWRVYWYTLENDLALFREGDGLPWWLSGKDSTCNAGEVGSIPGWGRSPEGGHGNPLQYSCLENPMDRGARRATVHRDSKSQTRLKRQSIHTCKEGNGVYSQRWVTITTVNFKAFSLPQEEILYSL